jgi:hypothetical protein
VPPLVGTPLGVDSPEVLSNAWSTWLPKSDVLLFSLLPGHVVVALYLDPAFWPEVK